MRFLSPVRRNNQVDFTFHFILQSLHLINSGTSVFLFFSLRDDLHRQYMDTSLANKIADAVVTQFESIQLKAAKPVTRSNGTPEWTVLAGLVAIQNGSISVLTLATGVKAMPDEVRNYSAGWIVHDMHAEILCLRMFNWLMVEEILAFDLSGLDLIERTDTERPGYRIKSDITLALYVSEPPCGDASMSYISAEREPWEILEKDDILGGGNDGDIEHRISCSIKNGRIDPSAYQQADCSSIESSLDSDRPENSQGPPSKKLRVMRGRAHFSQVGIVRTKPGRLDSIISLSKSCSDKLCVKQFTGILNCITSLLVEPVYLDYLVIDRSKFKKEDFERCFRSRLLNPPSHPLTALLFDEDHFKYKKRSGCSPLPLCLVHSVKRETSQILQNGVRNGAYVKKKPPKPSGASILCKMKLYLQAKSILSDFEAYLDLKAKNEEREALKTYARNQLDNWPRTRSEDFELED